MLSREINTAFNDTIIPLKGVPMKKIVVALLTIVSVGALATYFRNAHTEA